MKRDVHSQTPADAAAFEAAHANPWRDRPDITPDDVAPTAGESDGSWWAAFVGGDAA